MSSHCHATNPYYCQRRHQSIEQQQNPLSLPSYKMPDLHAALRVSKPDVQAEIEMLRQRIDELQRSEPTSGSSHPPAPLAESSTYLHQRSVLQPQVQAENSGASAPPKPPAYVLSPAHHTPSVSKTSSRSTTNDCSSLPSLPRVSTLDSSTRALHLTKPVAIPATNAKLGSPFLRAYPRCLAEYALPPDTFMRFIDDLNRVAIGNPPLRVLGLAGSITGMVPLVTAQIVGNAVSLVAQVGTVAVSKGRTEMYMHRANKDVFVPRGLKAEIAKLDVVAKMANIPILDDLGKTKKNSKLLEYIGVEDLRTLSGQERRLATLSQWIQPLELESLPAIEEMENPLRKLSQAASERERKKGEKKLIKEREKWHQEGEKLDREYREEMGKQEAKEEKVRRKKQGHKLEEELDKIARERRKIEKEHEKESAKLIRDNKEEKAIRKILWLVIRNLDEDNGAASEPYVYEQPEP